MFDILPSWIKIILWGSAKDDGVKKAPMVFRILLGITLTGFWLGLTALVLWVGLADGKMLLTALGILCLLSVPIAVVLEMKMKKEH